MFKLCPASTSRNVVRKQIDTIAFHEGPKDDRDVPSCCYLTHKFRGGVQTTPNSGIGRECYGSALAVIRPVTAAITGNMFGACQVDIPLSADSRL
jgi:hypothetical protein